MGNVQGEPTLYVFPSWVMLARGSLAPPPEKAMSAAAAFGTTLPDGVVCRSVSTGTQPDAFSARTGTGSNSTENVPSGCAVTSCVGVVSALTSTGEPDAAASCDAAASGDRSLALPPAAADEGSASAALAA
ncbi:hypothetical protein ACIQVL_47295 [Streptomyces sp. NPDC090499]|uniref:hypothetical protein n=1 Tax=Streptomyces sp. NPDC090499 TaxID=3365965 RepID=UPI003802B2D3